MTYCGARRRRRRARRSRAGSVLAPVVELRPPGRVGRPGWPASCSASQRGDQVGDDLPGSRRRSARRRRRFLRISAGSMSAWMTLAFGAKRRQLAGDPVVEAGAEATIRSAFCSAVTAATVPCMPGMPRCCGWLSGNAPRAISVVTTGMPVSSASARSSALAPRPDHAAADVEHRPRGLGDQPGGLADLLAVRPGHRAVAGQVELGRPGERGLRLQRVLGDVDEHRARAAGAGDVERLGDRPRDLGGVGDQVVVLGDRHRDAADVGLLEGVGADRRPRHLAGDRDDRAPSPCRRRRSG